MWAVFLFSMILFGCQAMPDWLSYTDEKGRKIELKRPAQPCAPMTMPVSTEPNKGGQ